MGTPAWDLRASGFSGVKAQPPRLTIRCEYPGTSLAPTCVTFKLSHPTYGIHTAREAHDWFLTMMREHEEFEVETDQAGEWPMPFWSETVRPVVAR